MATPSCKLLIEGIGTGSKVEEVKALLEKFGEVIELTLGIDSITGKNTGSATALFADSTAASDAVQNLMDDDSLGGKLQLNYSSETDEELTTTIEGDVENMLRKLRLAGYNIQKSIPDSTEHVSVPQTSMHYKPWGPTPFQPPRISIFSGDAKPKPGEITFEAWKYEVSCLLQERSHTLPVLTPVVRRSLRGEAAEIIRFLGPQASIHTIMDKLDSIYGTVESGAVLLQQVYLSRQEANENASAFGLRLQLALLKCRERGGIAPDSVDSTLKIVFWQGLSDHNTKTVMRHKYDKLGSFDEILREVRKAEQETKEALHMHKANAGKNRPIQAHQQTPLTSPDSEPNMMHALGMLSTRLEKLEGDVAAKHKTSPPNNNKDERNGVRFLCYRCGKPNHISRGCRNTPTKEWLQRQQRRNLNEQGTLPGDKQ